MDIRTWLFCFLSVLSVLIFQSDEMSISFSGRSSSWLPWKGSTNTVQVYRIDNKPTFELPYGKEAATCAMVFHTYPVWTKLNLRLDYQAVQKPNKDITGVVRTTRSNNAKMDTAQMQIGYPCPTLSSPYQISNPDIYIAPGADENSLLVYKREANLLSSKYVLYETIDDVPFACLPPNPLYWKIFDVKTNFNRQELVKECADTLAIPMDDRPALLCDLEVIQQKTLCMAIFSQEKYQDELKVEFDYQAAFEDNNFVCKPGSLKLDGYQGPSRAEKIYLCPGRKINDRTSSYQEHFYLGRGPAANAVFVYSRTEDSQYEPFELVTGIDFSVLPQNEEQLGEFVKVLTMLMVSNLQN